MKRKDNKKSPVSTICSALGTILLITIILGCIPLTVPRMLGYQLYTVISGSMEPAIPVGSLVFIKDMEARDVEVDDVIAFYGGRDTNAIITHRVVKNKVIEGEFITKGDANQTEDMNPVDYQEFIGRVELSIPKAGNLAQVLTSRDGKIAAASMIALAVVLQVIAALFEDKK